MDGSFDVKTISLLTKLLHKNGNQDTYYKPIIIKDESENNFVSKNEDDYPYKLETIVMCYYGQHQLKAESPSLHSKI